MAARSSSSESSKIDAHVSYKTIGVEGALPLVEGNGAEESKAQALEHMKLTDLAMGWGTPLYRRGVIALVTEGAEYRFELSQAMSSRLYPNWSGKSTLFECALRVIKGLHRITTLTALRSHSRDARDPKPSVVLPGDKLWLAKAELSYVMTLLVISI